MFEATVMSIATANLLHQRLTEKQVGKLEKHAANLLRAYLNVGSRASKHALLADFGWDTTYSKLVKAKFTFVGRLLT